MSLNVLMPKSEQQIIVKPEDTKTAREKRLSRPPLKPSKKFPLTKKEIQAVHVATVHLNVWLLDAAADYHKVEELYNSIKAVSWAFYETWDTEVAYAKNNLNKLADKLPEEVVSFTIPVGQFFTELKDEDNNIVNIYEPSLKIIKIKKYMDNDISVWGLQRTNFINSDTNFTAKVKWLQPTINPLTFGLHIIMVLSESKNIDEKLRLKWLRLANEIYFEVESQIGITDYSLKNSSILASLYTNNMYQDYLNNGVIKTYN